MADRHAANSSPRSTCSPSPAEGRGQQLRGPVANGSPGFSHPFGCRSNGLRIAVVRESEESGQEGRGAAST